MGRAPAPSFCYKHWKQGPNVLMHHKGKRSDRKKSFRTSSQNLSKSLKLCYDFWPKLFKTFPKEAGGSHVVITRWCHRPNLRGLRRWWERWTVCYTQRKKWIPLTNYGKDDDEFGFALLSSFLRRRFGSPPNCFIVNAQPCGCVSCNKSKFLLEAAGNKQNERVWDNRRGCMQNAILCQSNQFKALHFLCSISHCAWMGITIEVEERSSLIMLRFHFHYISASINKKLKGTKHPPRTKVQRMSKSVIRYGISLWQIQLESNIPDVISVHCDHHKIVVK